MCLTKESTCTTLAKQPIRYPFSQKEWNKRSFIRKQERRSQWKWIAAVREMHARGWERSI